MSRLALAAFALAVTAVAAAEDTPAVPVRLVADGKPAAGAKVWVSEYSVDKETEPKPLAAGADGTVSVPRPKDADRRSWGVYARDAAGRVGWAWLPGPGDEPDAKTELTLVATAGRAGRVTAGGKPVVGATVTPTIYYREAADRRAPGGPPASVPLPAWEQKRLTARTDAEGRFTLVAPTAGYSIWYTVTADGFGTSRWGGSAGVDLDTPLVAPGAVTITAAGVELAALKGASIRLSGRDPDDGKPGVRQARYFTGTFDATGTAAVAGVAPGTYELSVDRNSNMPAVFEKAEPVAVASGKTARATATFGPAAKVTGRIVAEATGKGLAGAQVIVNVTDGQSRNPLQQLFVETDKDGTFTAHGPAGWYLFWLQTAPDGFATPPNSRRGGVEPVKVDAGKGHAFAPYKLLTAVTFTGKVVDADRKPVAGATITHARFEGHVRNAPLTTDKDGVFTITNLPPDDAVAPRVRSGTAVNVPETFELEKLTGPVTLEVSAANAAGFKGRVLDGRGKPLAGAKVALRQSIQGVGRNAEYGTYGGAASTTTDADGRYAFSGYWPRDRYGVEATADGYTAAESKQLVGEAGVVKEFPDLKLTRANLAVSGTVVGPDGKPVAGAELFGVDGATRFTSASAADGTFTLTGFYDGGAFVFARKEGYKLAAVPVFPGTPDRVTVALAKTDSPPGPQPEVSAEHRAALNKFTRHALTRVWENHAAFGYGGNALEDMARIDPATAKKWRDEEKKRTEGKTDFTRLIDRVERHKALLDTARDDIDEALALIGALKPDDGFTEAVRVGEQMLAVDKAKALRLAEEAVVKARQRELPARIWSLAEAGDLAARAGGAGGKKVLAEAAELAEKLGPDDRGRNSLAAGLAAAHLAPYDVPKAAALLKTLKDPSDYNRFVAATAARLARTDLAGAKALFDRFKPDGASYPQTARVRVALAVAAAQPDEARKLVEGVTDPYYRVLGLVQLAAQFAPADKPRAIRTIDAAFDLLDRDTEGFRSYSGFGERAGLAAVATVRAKQIGHPDVASLVARTLALRPTARDAHSPENREERLVNVAAVLALVDPTAARHVLAGVAPPDEFVARAVGQRRDWLFALALADPGRATALADKLIARAKDARDGRNALSDTGLVELGSVLTARDPLRELTRYGNLPREIDDD